MTSISNEEKLIQQITDHEGNIPYAYQDSKGYWTIGRGRMIDKRLHGGISDDESLYLLNNDLASIRKQLSLFAWFKLQDEVRAGVIIELCFNIGFDKLLDFQNMICALKVLDYKKASAALIDSAWAKEVGLKRSSDMHHRLLYGLYK
jgi:lysozyme